MNFTLDNATYDLMKKVEYLLDNDSMILAKEDEPRNEPSSKEIVDSVIDLLRNTLKEIDNGQTSLSDIKEILSDAEVSLSALQDKI